MTFKSALLVGFGLFVISVTLSALAFPDLPARLPTQWDLSGRVTAESPKLVAVAMMPGAVGLTWALLLVLPRVSPRGFRIDGFARTYYLIAVAIVGVFTFLDVLVLRAQLTGSPTSNWLLFVAVGTLFAIVGNSMGKLRKNFFIGVRTPWTLASDEVWLRTNRIAGQLMVAGGFAMLGCAAFPTIAVALTLAIVTVVVIVPVGYSYLVYRQLIGFGSSDHGER